MTDSTIEERFDALKDRLELIEKKAGEAKAPWYSTASTLISVLAFLFSFGSTIVSYKRVAEQDVHSLRAELRGLLQRLSTLPKENLEAYVKYKNDQTSFTYLSSFINQENMILVRQANEALKKLPSDQTSATDYYAVALAQQASHNYQAAILNFNKALSVSVDLDDTLGALRSLANLQIVMGSVGDGRTSFQKAIDIFSTPMGNGMDDYTKQSTTILTYLNWAEAEAAAGDWNLVQKHFADAEQVLSRMQPGLGTESLRAQILDRKTRTLNGSAVSAASGALAPPIATPAVVSPPRTPGAPTTVH